MLADVSRGKLATTHDAMLGWMIAVGTLPIVVFGLAFKDAIETSLRSLYVVSFALIGLAVLLAMIELVVRRRVAAGDAGRDVGELTWRDAIVVGFAQAAALVPGTSRSGATIFGGLCSGLSREAAARYSFLLSIPSIALAGLYQLFAARAELLGSQSQVVNLVVALVVSAAVGYATIPWLLGFFADALDVCVHCVSIAAGECVAGAAHDGAVGGERWGGWRLARPHIRLPTLATLARARAILWLACERSRTRASPGDTSLSRT